MRDFKLVKPILAFGFKSRLMKPLVLTSLALALFVAPARAANDVPLVVDAIGKAQQAPADGKKWQITANVTITSPTAPTMTAKGVVNIAGDSEEAQLGGTLPMTVDGAAGGSSALAFNLKRDGGVGIQWTIAGKPFLGRPMSFYQAIPDPNGEYLSRKIKWNGASRFLLITLSAQQVEVSKGTPPRIRRLPAATAAKKEAIGKRYKITGVAQIANADDGTDEDVEVMGELSIVSKSNNVKVEKEVISLHKKTYVKNDKIPFKEVFFDYIFSDKSSGTIGFEGYFKDIDKSSSDDAMWPGDGRRYFRLTQLAGKGGSVIPGDRDSENVEVYFEVTEVEDLY